LLLTNIGSAFNVSRNLSFDKSLAGLCGLTHSELENVLKKVKPQDILKQWPSFLMDTIFAE